MKKRMTSIIFILTLTIFCAVGFAEEPPPGGGAPTPPPPPADSYTPDPGGGAPPPPPADSYTPDPGGGAPPSVDDPNSPPPGDDKMTGITTPQVNDPNAPPLDVNNPPPDGFDPMAGGFDPTQFDKDNVTGFGTDALNNITSDQWNNFDPNAMAGFDKDQISNFDPNAVAGFDKDQMAKFDPNVMAGFDKNQIGNFDPNAVAGFDKAQMAMFDPNVMAGFDKNQIAMFDPNAVGGFNKAQMAMFDPNAVAGFDKDKVALFDPFAVAGFKSQQLQNFNPKAIFGFDALQVQNFAPDEFKNMPSKDISEMLANFDPAKINPNDVQQLLPPDWNINANGVLQPPPGANLAFPSFAPQVANSIKLPDIPNFSKGFGLGGTGTDVIAGLNDTLAALGVGNQFNFKQSPVDGILHVKGSGDATGIQFAFLPDADKMVQAPDGTQPGLSLNQAGHYVLTTPDGMQIPLIPAPVDFSKIVDAIPGGSIEMGSKGETMLNIPGEGKFMGIFQETVIPDPQNRPPGKYYSGTPFVDEKIEIVLEDGTMQEMLPAIQSQTAFEELAKSIAGVENLNMKKDGTIDLVFSGTPISLKPALTIAKSQAGSSGTPTLNTKNDDILIFDDGNGNVQEFNLQLALSPN